MDLLTAVALSVVPGVPSYRVVAALRAFSELSSEATDPRASGTPTELPAILRLLAPAADVDRLVSIARARAAAALERAHVSGTAALGSFDPRYPDRLRAIADPPPVLWVKGQPASLDGALVAIVGSRAASPYAIEVAQQLAAELASRGACIVSGLARGVDSAAHRGALAGGGRTVAVLGSGVDVIYPGEHRSLAEEIVARGAVVSELPPGTAPRRHHFPLRNRIISGLSHAVVVVEASEDSGSLITARCALEQGREVMAVPGNILTGRNRGSHALLKDGAKIVERADDILEELRWPPSPSFPAPITGEEPAQNLLLDQMVAGETYDLDALISLSGLSGSELLPKLLELELKGLVRRTGGAQFLRGRRKVVT